MSDKHLITYNLDNINHILKCNICEDEFHSSLLNQGLSHLTPDSNDNIYICNTCVSVIFPFNHISDDKEFKDMCSSYSSGTCPKYCASKSADVVHDFYTSVMEDTTSEQNIISNHYYTVQDFNEEHRSLKHYHSIASGGSRQWREGRPPPLLIF